MILTRNLNEKELGYLLDALDGSVIVTSEGYGKDLKYVINQESEVEIQILHTISKQIPDFNLRDTVKEVLTQESINKSREESVGGFEEVPPLKTSVELVKDDGVPF